MKTFRKFTELAYFYLPFTRVDDDERIVEGYCYTSPKVKGDKWNLKRAALEAATTAYMAMPCIRSMHQSIAAGVGQAVEWNETGCLLRAKIVDDAEWNKVKEGVYRGFSLGGRPTIARGNDIEAFEWIETSLVDRPCDPGAMFTMARAEGVDAGAEYEVENIEEPEPAELDRALTAAEVPVRENLEPTVPELVEQIRRKLESADEADEMRAHLDACLGRVEITPNDNPELLTRAETAEKQAAEVLERAEKAESELSVVRADLEGAKGELEVIRGSLTDAEGEVEKLRAIRLTKPTVIGKAAAVERTFAANESQELTGSDLKRSELERERDELMGRKPEEMDQETRRVVTRRLMVIDQELLRLR